MYFRKFVYVVSVKICTLIYYNGNTALQNATKTFIHNTCYNYADYICNVHIVITMDTWYNDQAVACACSFIDYIFTCLAHTYQLWTYLPIMEHGIISYHAFVFIHELYNVTQVLFTCLHEMFFHISKSIEN